VLDRLSRITLRVTVVTIIGVVAATGQAQQKKVKDQGEYDLYNSVLKETDPNKRLGFLDQWNQKYPDSEFKKERLQYYLSTYQALNNAARMADAAKEILAMDPQDVTALYWLSLLTESLPPTAENLAAGEKAAKGLMAARKPEALKEEDWKNLKTEVIAHKTLGFIAAARKDTEAAEKHYTSVLELNPAFAQVSYALGVAILQQKKPEKYPQALFHLCRAVVLTGVGAWPGDKKQIDAFLIKTYTTYHGSTEGLDELKEKCKTSALPPPDLKILSKIEIEELKAKELAEKDPKLALWLNIKGQLVGPEGQNYFENTLKGSDVPQLKGKVISHKPALRPKEIVLGIEKADVPEVTLVLETAMPGKADPGTEIEFKGVPSAFTKEPFMVTFDVEGREKITGWPAPAPAAKKAAPKKGGAAKKK